MKKFVAILLCLVLVLSLSSVAFAAGPNAGKTEDFTDEQTVTVTKVFKLVGNGVSLPETFTLHQVGQGVVVDGEAESVPDLGTITGAAFEQGAATAEGAVGNISIALPIYNTVGVYKYTLKENVGSTAGVTYFGGNIELVVTVINDPAANGNLRIAAVHVNGVVEGGVKTDTFENTFSTGDLTITKNVTGILGDTEKYFKFTIGLLPQGNLEYAGSYTISGGTYENPETISVGTPIAVYLKDGETLTIKGLPAGLGYGVTEDSYAADGYTTTSTSNSTSNIIAGETQEVVFTNSKGGTVDTGVLMDSLPYVIVIGLVVILGTAMVVRRRREEQ